MEYFFLVEEWCEEARELVETLTLGKVLQAQIHGYTDQSVPLIFLYTVHDNEVRQCVTPFTGDSGSQKCQILITIS